MQDPKIQFSIARILISMAALIIIAVPIVQEVNLTHLLNPYWPAHARFQEAWLIGLMCFNGVLMMYLVWGTKQQLVFCSQIASLIGLAVIISYGAACITSPYYGGSAAYEGPNSLMLLGLMKTLWMLLGTSAFLLTGLILATALNRWQALPATMGEKTPSL